MRKSLFGYNISEVNAALDNLREENESLNATIVTLKTQIKNSISDSGAKANLLEADLKMKEEDLRILREEKKELLSQITSLSAETELLHQKNAELSAQLEAETEHKAALEQDLNAKIVALYSVRDEVAATASNLVEAQSRIDIITGEHEKETAQPDKILNGAPEPDAKPVITDSPAEDYANLRDMLAFSNTSLQAYNDISKIHNEAVNHIQKQMKDYYQLMNEIMEHFLEESNACLKAKEESSKTPFLVKVSG